MYKLGITGGIGSGKTTVSSLLEEKGATVFNADKEAKMRLQNSISLQHKLINLFGNAVTEKGHLVLSKLAQVAFSSKLNQDLLNGIMWPEVMILIDQAIIHAEKNNTPLLVVDAALIFEANLQNLLDDILLVSAPEEKRMARALRRKNLPSSQIQQRMALQLSEKEKIEKADFVIYNVTTLEDLQTEVDTFYKTLKL
ncbi:MAG: dephospho-CoA kinase [Candidatus Marinimicrobia bacterium]|jgi:dephospho-CoA kinase|nr:dephospho-CoA kinase [Candidatus Neomarinimicrobiota bacterium]MBT5956561.1 dephospho-CoA kinase [Candidatus Neomarinimicrobiota bacterium]MBT6871184.1 dephospho-CoA kinase [Candidatus Neomarinimicrobiota bacterium]MBT7376728.1 dephospho-CoA kinase [Candidatus Neomarinimicrobiota bacterium]|tara:strand:- start:3822 stop:4412 length:591 start_codon:yes stop_codon:yes gene_type:complete